MSGSSIPTQIVNSLNAGMLDEFGNGGVVNNGPAFYSIPAALASLPQSGWYVAQWGQPTAVNVADYTVNNPSTYDDLYGNALYSWSESGQTSAISLYQNTPSLGGGYVVQLTDGSTQDAPQGQTDEADMFLSSPGVFGSDGSLSHSISLSLSEKITQSDTDFLTSALASEYATSGPVFSAEDIGFTIEFNGADGLPSYGGFVQIDPWVSDSSNNANYESDNLSPGTASWFVSSLLLGTNTGLSVLPSDSNATPDGLSFNINQYVKVALSAEFASFSASQQAILLNENNWSVGGFYIGLATNNVPTGTITSGPNVVDVAKLSSTIQLSNISIAANLNAAYNPSVSVTPQPKSDINPQINFDDVTMKTMGSADGGAYVGNLTGIKDEYIYNGYDDLSLTAPAGNNWYFGGGYGPTTLSAISGNNVFLASVAGSQMNGGTGNDTFVIQSNLSTANSVSDTISNFHAGDETQIDGASGGVWTYTWSSGVSSSGATELCLTYSNSASPGVTNMLNYSGLTINDISHFQVSTNLGNGDLSISSTNAPTLPVIATYNIESSISGYLFGAFASGNAVGTSGAAESFAYSGGVPIVMYAPIGTNVVFGGGSQPTILDAVSGVNEFNASTGSSWMIGGTGNDTFNIPDANRTGNSVWDVIQNFHYGDTVALAGLGGAGWTYSWINTAPTASNVSGLTLCATSTLTPGLTECVTFNGLTQQDVAGINMTPSSSTGSLMITAKLPLNLLNLASSNATSVDQAVSSGGSLSSATIIEDMEFLTGTTRFNFIGGSGIGNLALNSGINNSAAVTGIITNTLYASAVGSHLMGNTMNDAFLIPDETQSGLSAWDIISNFHPGDSVYLAGLLGPDWSYQFSAQDQGSGGYSGLTLDATNSANPGVSEHVTFANISPTLVNSMSLAAGTGAHSGALMISWN